MAAALVAARVRALGGSPAVRSGFVSDDGMAILDVSGLDLSDPERLEAELAAIPGVVESGIFAHRRADVVLVGGDAGVRTVTSAADLERLACRPRELERMCRRRRRR